MHRAGRAEGQFSMAGTLCHEQKMVIFHSSMKVTINSVLVAGDSLLFQEDLFALVASEKASSKDLSLAGSGHLSDTILGLHLPCHIDQRHLL